MVLSETIGRILDSDGNVIFEFLPSAELWGHHALATSTQTPHKSSPSQSERHCLKPQICDPDTGVSVFGPTLDANELSPCSLMDMNGDGIDELFWRGTED